MGDFFLFGNKQKFFENYYRFIGKLFGVMKTKIKESKSFLLGARCDKALGMKNGRIRKNQLTASSSWDKNHGPNNGRLHLRRVGAQMGAWCARHNNRLQWYQVNFGRPTRVVKFATQGRQDARQWVTQYYLTFSQDGVHYAEYKENSNRKVLYDDVRISLTS